MDIKVFEEWLDAYRRAWEGRDPEAAARLFTDDGTYQETPFDEPLKGRAAIRNYWENVPRGQEQIECATQVLAFASHGEGVAHWTTRFLRVPGGQRVELDGIFVVRLSEDGRCTQFREWWHRREEDPLSPISDWGRDHTALSPASQPVLKADWKL